MKKTVLIEAPPKEVYDGATRLTQRSRWVPKHSMSDPNMLAEEAEAEIQNNLNRLK